jgi:hypothetical protein
MTQHRRGLTRAQDVAVLDAVRAKRHRADHRHDLAPRVRGARPVAEPNPVIDELLDAEALSKQRRQHHPRIGDRPLIIEHHDRRAVHHVGDLLSRAAAAAISRFQALLGRSLHPNTRTERRSRLSEDPLHLARRRAKVGPDRRAKVMPARTASHRTDR